MKIFTATKMNLFGLFSTTIFVFSLSSCETSIKASADWAKQQEKGNSAVPQIYKTVYNLGVFGTYFGGPGPDDSKDDTKNQNNNFGVGAGFEFVGKGGKYHDGSSIALNYFEVPLYGLARFPVNDNSSVYAGLGPYFAYGIGGKIKSGNFSESSFGENNGGYKRFDAGLSIMADYKIKQFSVGLNYDLGLANTVFPGMDITSKGRSFAINVGYSLGALFKRK